jgi:hypothetical protein
LKEIYNSSFKNVYTIIKKILNKYP